MKSITGPLIKLIVFAVITVITTSMLALTIGNVGGSGDSEFKAVFDDAAMLNAGDDVRIAGVRVGQVTDVKIHNRNQALVTFNADRDRLRNDLLALFDERRADVRYRLVRKCLLDDGALERARVRS